MSAACFTASTDVSLIRATWCPPSLLQRLRVVQREAIRHPGDELDDRVGLVAARDEVLEDPRDHAAGACVLALRMLAEIDPLEHERAQREHRLADLVALADVAGS